MNVIRFLYFIATIVEVAKSSAEADNGSVLAQSLFESKHMVRGSGSNDEKKTGNKDEEISSIYQNSKRMLEAGAKRLLQLISINIGCCDDDDEGDESNDDDKSDDDDESSDSPSMYPSHSPSIAIYEEKKLVASDGSAQDYFGWSCSISDELVLIGATGVNDFNLYDRGAAYLFNLDGTEVAKLPSRGRIGEEFGYSVAIDEKIVIGTGYSGANVQVFSRDGIYERTITCDDCLDYRGTVETLGNLIATYGYGQDVATLGNLIVTSGHQNSIWKLFIYSTVGQLLKTLEQEDWIYDVFVAMSDQFIVSTALDGKTIIYSNTSPDFPEIAEIEQGGWEVAVSGDRIVIGNPWANDYGAAYLYKTDGTLVKTLDRQDASSNSRFGFSVDMTDDKVIAGAVYDDDKGYRSGSVFIYSAVTGEFLEKVVAPDGEAYDRFGRSVCASDSYFVVGAPGDNDNGDWTGAAYLFQFSEE